MSEENQAVESQATENEGLLDQGIEEVRAEEQAQQDANPEVIEGVFAKDPEEVNTAIADEGRS